jgi:antitoxin component YwqK of YwqJK toxin-antitoxin module
MLTLALLTGASAGVVRHALIVGSNDGGSELAPLQYAEQDADRIRLVLTELGGFAPERITMLREPGRDELLAALQEHANIASASSEDMFVFYYSGHATARGLKLGEETLPYEELRGSMNELDSEVRLGVLDACRSGEITRLKGLTLSEPFATDDALTAEGEAWLTASAYDEDSQESDHLQGSFFTHYLVSGLRGAADRDDGVVSLSEAYDYAHDQTVSRTGRTDAGTQHPAYNYRMQGAGDLALTDVRQASARIIVPENIAGVITVLSLPDEMPLVEVAKKQDAVTTIALPPGQYKLRLKDNNGTSEIPRLQLNEGASATLPDFSRRPAELAMLKGAGEEGIDESYVFESDVFESDPDESDIAASEPPPLLKDPSAPRLLEDPEAALLALGERAEAIVSYQSQRANSWLMRHLPGTTTVVDTTAPAPVTELTDDVGYHYIGVCDAIGPDCLHAAAAAEPLDGVATLTWPSGVLAAEGMLADGIPTGAWTFYDESGQPHSAGQFSNGVTQGEWTWWYPSGQKRMKGQLQGEARVGTWLEWYETGKKKSRTEYSNGAPDGRRVDWYPTGQKKSEGTMIGERRDGEWVSYYEDGRKQARGAYNERGRAGTWTTWSDNGVKASRGRYVDDLRQGSWTFWWESGTVSAEGSYRRGSKEGRWEVWYASGVQRSRASYTDGVLDGLYREWDERGAPVAKGRYRDGEPVGLWSRWGESGRQLTWESDGPEEHDESEDAEESAATPEP